MTQEEKEALGAKIMVVGRPHNRMDILDSNNITLEEAMDGLKTPNN